MIRQKVLYEMVQKDNNEGGTTWIDEHQTIGVSEPRPKPIKTQMSYRVASRKDVPIII